MENQALSQAKIYRKLHINYSLSEEYQKYG